MRAKQFFFVMIAFIALSLAAVAGSFVWGKNLLATKAAAVSDLEADRDIAQEKILRLQKAQNDSKNLEKVSKLLDRLLPRTKEQDKLVADIIYTSTSEAGIPFSKVKSFSFSGGTDPDSLSGSVISKENPGVYEYPFSLQIDDISYETLLQLLTEIETNGRIVQVANIQIAPGADDPNILIVSLSMKAYLQP